MKRKLNLAVFLLTGILAYNSWGQKESESIASVTIGNQVWMVKNLDVGRYRNGDPIPEVKNPKAWAKLTTGAWCYYNNDPANGAIYGKLYNWYAVHDPRGLAPSGWHVPTDPEWTALTTNMGGEDVAGGKLKETGTTHWKSPNKVAANESGFAALPDGNRSNSGFFGSVGTYGDWWSATELGTNYARYRLMSLFYSHINRLDNDKEAGFSVRCVRD